MANDANEHGEASTTELREHAAELVNQAAFGGRRTIIKRRGKALAALVPMADLERLEALEDAADAREGGRVLERMAGEGDAGVPWEEAKRMLRDGRAAK